MTDPKTTASLVIGIIGPPGSGKSAVSRAFQECGAEVLSLDAIGHELLADDGVKRRIRDAFGGGVFAPDGAVSRKDLAARVFPDAAELAKLNAIVHPPLVGEAKRRIASWRAQEGDTARGLVVEGALLIEFGLHESCDHVVFVTAPFAVRLERVTSRRGWTEEELERRERAQLSDEERRARSDVVIENVSTLNDMRTTVMGLWKEWT